MATTRTPPERWIAGGLEVLAERGPDAVRIEPLAQSLGVTKGGFYWHFKDRQALLEGILDTWERESLRERAEEIEAGGGDAAEKLRRLFSIASHRPDLQRAELAIREWARRDPRVAARLRSVDKQRLDLASC